MSLYLTMLFVLLITEMVTLLVLLLPLPHLIRKKIGHLYHSLSSLSQIKTVLVVSSILVTSLFVDSIKRGNRPLPMDRSLVTPEMLASKAYHQRNIYISGFILYFGICVPIVMGVIAKLVKYEEMSRKSQNDSKLKNGKNNVINIKLFEQLKQKEAELMALEKQYNNQNTYLDQQLDEALGKKPLEDKKKE